ncbi:MAG: hypothetical protein ABR498_05265 [Candidatus Dormibacteria bacterium]
MPTRPTALDATPFDLQPGEMYRISYALGSPQLRRVTRSLAVFGGSSLRRQWDGNTVPCLDFTRPQGRPLSLVGAQLVDARLATLNERGQVVLAEQRTRPRRHTARRRQRRAA